MGEKQLIPLYKKSSFLLGLLLAVFFLKGLVFAATLPLLQGFDEHNHFSTSEDFAPKSSASNEVRLAGGNSDFDRVRNTLFNTQGFTNGTVGINENRITANNQSRGSGLFAQNFDGQALFYRITIFVNDLLASQNLLVRFFALRILSVFFGVWIVYLVFLMAKHAGFSEKSSLLISAIFAFQPMLTNVTSIINYDVMMTLAFTLFAYAAIRLIQGGLSWKFLLLAVLAAAIGFFTKGTGIVLAGLLIPLIIYVLQKKYQLSLPKFLLFLLVFLLIASVLANFFSPYTLDRIARVDKQSHFATLGKSLQSYYSTTISGFEKYSRTYWGDFGWINAPISNDVLHFIWLIEIVCLVGLLTFLIRKKNPEFLPAKKIVIALIIIFLALQIGVRFADWAAFNNRGIIIYGTSGRYFMPALFAHIILLVIGAGALLKREKTFMLILKCGLVLMVILYCYSLLSVLIPRYYL